MATGLTRQILWWLCLAVAPAILCLIELYHPAGFTTDPGMFEYLSKPQPHTAEHHALAYFGPQWWFTLHMIQTPMIGLVAIGLWLMVDNKNVWAGIWSSTVAWVSRIATFVFAVYYTALDAIGGIGLGRTIQITKSFAGAPPGDEHLTPDQLDGVILVLNTTWTDPWVGGVGSFISLTGSWAAFAAALGVALALGLTNKTPLVPLAGLVAFGWFLQESHASYTGPIAFALLIVSAFWIWFATERRKP